MLAAPSVNPVVGSPIPDTYSMRWIRSRFVQSRKPSAPNQTAPQAREETRNSLLIKDTTLTVGCRSAHAIAPQLAEQAKFGFSRSDEKTEVFSVGLRPSLSRNKSPPEGGTPSEEGLAAKGVFHPFRIDSGCNPKRWLTDEVAAIALERGIGPPALSFAPLGGKRATARRPARVVAKPSLRLTPATPSWPNRP